MTNLLHASVAAMSFVASAELLIDSPADELFARLADVQGWPTWMPASFVLATRGAPSTLARGTRFRVKLAGAPFASTLRVSVFLPGREIAWRGGTRGLLHAEHRFVFEPEGTSRTRVRSIETWRGALARLSRRIVQPVAERVGAAQLAGLARD